MTPLVVVTHDPEGTLELAARIGGLLRGGDVVGMSGELGAGKTVFAKGVARALGVTDRVVSPTFTVVREYDGCPRMVHVDVYRLDHVQELHDVGWDDLLDDESVAVVEWADRVTGSLPADRLEVRLELGELDDDRVLTFEARGSTWFERVDALTAAVDSWRAPGGPFPHRAGDEPV